MANLEPTGPGRRSSSSLREFTGIAEIFIYLLHSLYSSFRLEQKPDVFCAKHMQKEAGLHTLFLVQMKAISFFMSLSIKWQAIIIIIIAYLAHVHSL